MAKAFKSNTDFEVLVVTNNGQLITETNYWQSEYAYRDLVYISINAGAFRMLLPLHFEMIAKQIKTGKHVVISKGFHQDYRREMYEFMFEDYTDSPFSLWVCPEQICPKPANFDSGKEFKFLLYSNGLKFELQMPAFYRTVSTLPSLKAWKAN